MSNVNTLSLQMMSSPLNLQQYVLKDLEERIENGKYSVNDPNSVAMHLIESNNVVVSQLSQKVIEELDRQNPKRAQTIQDLYRHMSDYDYTDLYSKPSECTFILGIDKSVVINEGVNINDNYKVLVIPKDTIFNIGEYKFTLYYPVEIQVDVRGNIALVTYDISTKNPLKNLESNRVDFYEQRYMGMDLIYIKLNIYQFVKTKKEEAVTSALGFTKKYTYVDKFYAIRVFTNNRSDGVLTELSQTFSEDNYDPYTPTTRVLISPDESKFTVNIPQIYFTKGLIGSKIIMELYTTKGDISINVGSAETDQIKVDFFANGTVPIDEYNSPFQRMPTIVGTVYSDYTTGGVDGTTMEVLRDKIIYDSFTTDVIITPKDFTAYFAGTGISVARHEDNLTDLTYFAYKALTDENSSVIPATNTYFVITPNTYKTVSTVKLNLDNSITILPSTLFKYNEEDNSSIPVNDTERNVLSSMSNAAKIVEFNTNRYVRTPFHIRIDQSNTYPIATSYNLLTPSITDTSITAENVTIAAQMYSASEGIVHKNEGTGGYTCYFMVRTDILDEIPDEDKELYIYTYSAEGLAVGMYAKYTGMVDDTFAKYELDLNTEYYIDDKGNLSVTSLALDGVNAFTYKIPIKSKFYLVFMVKSRYYPEVTTNPSLFEGVPEQQRANKIVMLRQTTMITLGYSLSDVILNDINISWQSKQYTRYEIDEPFTYKSDVYREDEDGIPEYIISDGNLLLDLYAEKGDTLLTEIGEPNYQLYLAAHPGALRKDYVSTLGSAEKNTYVAWKYQAGDIILDDFNNPIEAEDRVQQYMVMAIGVDARMYMSEYPVQKNLIRNLPSTLESYFSIIRSVKSRVRERTKLYFRPTATFGMAKFGIGDSITTTLPIAMSFAFRVHVDNVVLSDNELLKSVTASITSLLEEMLTSNPLSQTKIADKIKESISYIYAVDALGICGDSKLQTVSILTEGIQPSVDQILYLTEDKTLAIKKDVSIEFVQKPTS